MVPLSAPKSRIVVSSTSCKEDMHFMVALTVGGLMTRGKFLLATVALTAGLYAQNAPPKTHLKVGDTAPDFTLPATTGKPVKLSDFRGKKNVVLAFFPAAFTGG